MKKVLFINTRRSDVSAEYIRVKYFMNSFEENGINVVKYETKPSTLSKYVNYLISILPVSIKKIQLENDVDLVIASVPPVLNAIVGYEYASKHNKPLIIDIRDIWEEYVKISKKLEYRIGLLKKIIDKYYKALNYATILTVTTSKMMEYYREVISSKEIYVVPNGVDINEIKCSGNEEKKYDLVYLANFNYPYHAVEVLIDTIRNTDLSLLLIGSGEYLNKLKKYIAKFEIKINIEYTGSIPYVELPKHLCRAKVGVSGRPFINNPEFLYTIPVKIYEYIGAGLPVLAYGPPNSAVEDFITKHSIGYYIGKKDDELMLEKIDELVTKHRNYYEKCISTASIYNRRELARDFVKLINRVFEIN